MPTLGAPELIIILVILIIIGLVLLAGRVFRSGPTGSSTPKPESLASQLEKLTELRNRGAISDQEFEAAKRKLLS